MLTAFIHNIQTAENLLISAAALAANLKMEFGVLCYAENELLADTKKEIIQKILSEKQLKDVRIYVRTEAENELAGFCETVEASFLILQLSENKKKIVQKYLNYCRELRIPYLFFKDEFPVMNLDKVMLPVGFLVEELEKAQFASAFGRFCSSQIFMLLANDYGSKAAANAEKMKLIFDKFSLNYSLEKAKADSFKVEKEAVEKAFREEYGIVIISASREYGLDDLLFGPKELHLVRNSPVPLLIVNPRGDLYTLCD